MLIINLLPYLFCTKCDEDSEKRPKIRMDSSKTPFHPEKCLKIRMAPAPGSTKKATTLWKAVALYLLLFI